MGHSILNSVASLSSFLPSCNPFNLQVADLYCSACKCALCEDCLPNHAEHPKVALSQALEQHRNNLQERLGTVQDRYRVKYLIQH